MQTRFTSYWPAGNKTCSAQENATASAADRAPLGKCSRVSNESVPQLPAGSVSTTTRAIQTRAQVKVNSASAVTSSGLSKVCPRSSATGYDIACRRVSRNGRRTRAAMPIALTQALAKAGLANVTVSSIQDLTPDSKKTTAPTTSQSCYPATRSATDTAFYSCSTQ